MAALWRASPNDSAGWETCGSEGAGVDGYDDDDKPGASPCLEQLASARGPAGRDQFVRGQGAPVRASMPEGLSREADLSRSSGARRMAHADWPPLRAQRHRGGR